MRDFVAALHSTSHLWLAITFYVSLYVAFATHELGHYFVARVFGLRVSRLVVGSYGPICVKRYRGTLFVFRCIWLPWGAEYIRLKDPRDESEIRNQLAAVLSAGIATNMLCAGLFAVMNMWLHSQTVAIFELVAFATGVGQLIPIGASDGQLIWNHYRHGRMHKG